MGRWYRPGTVFEEVRSGVGECRRRTSSVRAQPMALPGEGVSGIQLVALAGGPLVGIS